MRDACRLWRKKLDADKTWANCKEHFREEAGDMAENATSGNQGYHGANFVSDRAEQVLQAATDALQANMEQIANYAAKATSDTSTIADLTAQLAAAKAENKVLRERNPNQPHATRSARVHYCWTHGHKCNHTGHQCENPAAGHVATATARDTKGGSTAKAPR
jgi:hypothetical protein